MILCLLGGATPGKAWAGPDAVLFYTHPAEKWENAFPAGNGRLGAMVFGGTAEEQIQLNEATYWSGGPYSTVVKGGREALPEIQKLLFEGQYKQAHVLFGRRMMGYPVEQQKYQALANLVLSLDATGDVSEYRHELDLDTAVITTRYVQDGVRYTREVLVSPVHQVVLVRLTANQPGRISFTAQLRGYRNTAHSNYATDYFQMEGQGSDGLVLRGRSADYMGVGGKLRYEARLRASATGGTVRVDDDVLSVSRADAVTLVIAAATNFVNYKDVTGDPAARVEQVMKAAVALSFERLKQAHTQEHQRLFRRASIELPATENSKLPTDERLKAFDGSNDPALAGLLFQYGRYLLISSSRPGGQPANLQGLWNKDMNPMWDSKYTTNINTQMNYWMAETANLSECAEPLFRMIRELTDQGSETAKEFYGARGWVQHQNTDLWRVTAPMDGPSWGAFTTGGAWLSTHLWEHYLYTGDTGFLREYYPVLKGSAEFFLDFLKPDPKRGWLVTNPSTSPENFPAGPANVKFFDEVTTMKTGTSLTAGSTIDMEILRELFSEVAEASSILGFDPELRGRLTAARARLAPLQVGRKGNLQEWLDDWDETEKSHRHISGLWGLYPGHEISPRETPAFAAASQVVLEQRGLPGNGWSSAWKAACWARLGNGDKAMENVRYAVGHYTTTSLFSICSNAMQVDGAFGMSAAIGEMLLQSDGGEIRFVPALPQSLASGSAKGLRARGGFEVDFRWQAGVLEKATILSSLGKTCRIRTPGSFAVTSGGRSVVVTQPEAGVIEFATKPGETYSVALAGSGAGR
ncbi:glycoside hydrolase family 95 protein [Paludibaculum fermentans]|uniref:glycoside hydrolase family 95 protein n=1 Tax=Paludibaculum fermentans TaxID=1473598 RepID=UPI001E3C5152|nr:glycoside hydrolase family 95 protein [Paludibaculum fermentans]